MKLLDHSISINQKSIPLVSNQHHQLRQKNLVEAKYIFVHPRLDHQLNPLFYLSSFYLCLYPKEVLLKRSLLRTYS
jgi:hypothetical protein